MVHHWGKTQGQGSRLKQKVLEYAHCLAPSSLFNYISYTAQALPRDSTSNGVLDKSSIDISSSQVTPGLCQGDSWS